MGSAEERLYRAEARLKAELQAMDRRHALSAGAHTEVALRPVFEAGLDAAIDAHGADFGTVQLYDPQDRSLRIVAQRGFDQAFADHFARVVSGDGSACAQALAQRRRIHIEDVERNESFAPHLAAARDAGFRSVLSQPLVAIGGDVLGMLSVHFRAPHQLHDDDYWLTDILARELARAIEQTRQEIALRESEARQLLLSAELQHRVRNVLAMVRAIARQTLTGSAAAEELAGLFEGRLNALARTQALLARAPDAGVDLEMMIREELLAQVADSARIAVKGGHIELAARPAEMLTLAIHELATNATKYGALADGGKIEVSWTVAPRDGVDWLQLRWRETGVRVVSMSPRRAGFGTELIERAVPHELNGEGRIAFLPGRVEADIAFPLSAPKRILD